MKFYDVDNKPIKKIGFEIQILKFCMKKCPRQIIKFDGKNFN